MFLYRRLQRYLFNDKKRLLNERYSLASRDGQRRAFPRAEVISIVFTDPRFRHSLKPGLDSGLWTLDSRLFGRGDIVAQHSALKQCFRGSGGFY